MPARLVRASAIFVAVALSACQAAATAAPPSAGGSATQAPPSAGQTSLPAPSPSTGPTGIPADEVTGSPGALTSGRYTRRGFEPRITFQVDGPWHSENAFHGFFDVQQDVGSPDVIAVQFATPDQIYAAPDQPSPITTAEAASTALQHNTRLVTVESSSSRIGGLSGFQVTVENPADKVGDAQVMHVSAGALSISPGRRLWCAFFDTPEGVLAILVGGSVARWDAALAAAEPVLESVTIGQ